MTPTDDPQPEQTLVTVAVLTTIPQAAITRSKLEQAGIRTWLQNEQTSGQLWQVGFALGGIQLQVADIDAEAARAILEELATLRTSSGPAWTCSNCNAEVEPSFEICWKCQTPRQADTA